MITDYSWGAGERSKPEYEPAAIPGRFAQLVLCAWFLDAAYLYGKFSHKTFQVIVCSNCLYRH